MARYLYQAQDANGKKYHGILEVTNETKLYEILRQQGKYVTSSQLLTKKNEGKKRIKHADLSMFCRQMASMLHAGLSMGDALESLCKKSGNEDLKRIALSLYEQLKKGTSLSKAMAQSMYSFPPIMQHMVEAGELGGKLDDIFEDLYKYFEAENITKNRVITAMTYPMILLVVSVGIVIFLMTSVLPKFFAFFGDTTNLPTATKILIAISNSLTQHWYIHVMNLLIIVLIVQRMMANEQFHQKFDHWKTTAPLFGKLNKIVYTSRFARTFASLFQSGVPIMESLRVCGEVLANRYYQACLSKTRESIQNGNSISAALEEAKCFDDLLISMVYVGEQSGELEGVLLSVAQYYDNESQRATDQMISLLQPIMILVLGTMIFFILVGVLTGVYSTYTGV